MPADLRDAIGSNNAGGGTTLTMTCPSAVRAGDNLVMGVTARGGTGTDVTPTWSVQTSSFSTTDINGVAFANGTFVAVGGNGKIATSTDAGTWTQRPASPFTTHITCVAYGAGRWVACGNGEIGTSTNTLDWTLVGSPPGAAYNDIAYGNGTWVVVCGSQQALVSPDGLSWTAYDVTAFSDPIYLNGVAFGNGLFVAVGGLVASGLARRIFTSPDGVTWTERTPAAGSGDIMSVAYGKGVFVYVGKGGVVASSPNGITWTAVSASDVFSTLEIWAVTFGGGMFCAVGAGVIGTSVDGGLWGAHTTPITDIHTGVCYGKGLFVAVCLTGGLDTGPAWGLLGRDDSGTTLKQAQWWKLAASEPASYVMTLSQSVKASGVIVAILGGEADSPETTQFKGTANGSSTSISSLGLDTFPASNGVDVGIFGTATGTTITPPTNYTEPVSAESASTGGGAGSRTTTEGCYRVLTGVTTVAAITATAGAAAVNAGFHVFISEARSLVYADRPIRRNTLLRR